jgi:hypothetical protein
LQLSSLGLVSLYPGPISDVKRRIRRTPGQDLIDHLLLGVEAALIVATKREDGGLRAAERAE